ncbi:MAG TPA: fructose 1,6-bisphosphatase [Actinomycetota bacterium]|nr:fructose 1,6-bisphosphatase [Actinomycetota bacterium]
MAATVSVLKSCPGGYVGSGHVHPAVVDCARRAVSDAKNEGLVDDAYVARCGDDLALVLLHEMPPRTPAVRTLAVTTFTACSEVAWGLGQFGCPDRGNGGPKLETAELVLEEPSEPVLCLIADKAGPGCWNAHLYRAFGDPFNTPSLLTDPRMTPGFAFEVDLHGGHRRFELPADLHSFLAEAAGPGFVRRVSASGGGAAAACASAGADPVLLVRCPPGLPSVGEVLESLSFPYAVAGWHSPGQAGPLMPVSTNDDAATRLDGPPRAIGLGFQVSGGRLVGPRDLLGDRAFDGARAHALQAVDYLRRHGPFAPGFAAAAPLPSRSLTI